MEANCLEPAGPDMPDGRNSVGNGGSVDPGDTELDAHGISGSQLPTGSRSSARSNNKEAAISSMDSTATGLEASKLMPPRMTTRSRDSSPFDKTQSLIQSAKTPEMAAKTPISTPVSTMVRNSSPYGTRSKGKLPTSTPVPQEDLEAADPDLTQPTQLVD